VDDPGFVRGLEPLGDLPAHVERFVERERAALQAVFQRLSRHELEHEEARVADLVDAVDLRHVRMIERGQRPRFALETPQAFLVVRELLREHLDRDLAIEARVLRAPHLAHRAGAQRTEDPVVREGLAGSERHADAAHPTPCGAAGPVPRWGTDCLSRARLA